MSLPKSMSSEILDIIFEDSKVFSSNMNLKNL